VVLKMRYPDFRTITRRVTLSQPTDLAKVIHAQAVQLLQQEWQQGTKLRLVGVGVTGLVGARQLTLFDGSTERLERLSRVVDEIRSKHGKRAIRRASLLESDDR
jgi:DNA polymerase-4